MPILETRLFSRHLQWPDEAACAATASELAGRGGIGDAFIELHGPLGAGKTTFARHLLQALGVTGRIQSPTYAVMETYDVSRSGVRIAIHHVDFYRFEDPQEFEDAGFRELFAGPGLKLAEWPENAAGLLPLADLAIHIEPIDGGAAREVRVDALTPLGQRLIG